MKWTGISLLASLLAACPGGDDAPLDAPPGDPPGQPDGPCAADVRIGGFEAALRDGFTSVQGTVADAVTPGFVPEEVASAGPCRLLRPPTLFCDPGCAPGTTCDASGMCIASPENISVGDIDVDGMTMPVSMSANPPVFFYTNLGPLDHPGFQEGVPLQLRAQGAEPIAAFSLDAVGVAPLSLADQSVLLDTDTPVVISWMPAASAEHIEIHIDLNIAQHGGTPGRIECEIAERDYGGQFELPVTLSNQLLAGGYSGFPSIVVTRRSADSVDTALGCVDWHVQSASALSVDIPGLISCSGDEDCPAGQTCQGDLTCG